MRTAIVTGGTRGIGAAISERLVRDGVHVAAVYRSGQEQAERFGLAMAGLPVSLHRADLAHVGECARVVAEIEQAHGPVGVLVNNAGILREAKVAATTEQLWDEVHDVNLKAAFFLTQAVWEGMVARGFGRIVNVSSVTATTGNPLEAAYGAAKAGLHGLTRSLALAGARKGITVNCVVPGVYDTDMTAGMDPAVQQRIAGMIPLGRRGRPEEIAHLVHALCAEDASYTTGALIPVGGGLAMGA